MIHKRIGPISIRASAGRQTHHQLKGSTGSRWKLGYMESDTDTRYEPYKRVHYMAAWGDKLWIDYRPVTRIFIEAILTIGHLRLEASFVTPFRPDPDWRAHPLVPVDGNGLPYTEEEADA